ncbi:Nif11-like leader peptide family RiPP precursor [Anoxynatronum sibiricum]|uniref:Nif11-like leader peptide family RiPP n=1 Tax=Anoxynatronum sibiricum TaxID=210623 RepID=A0ABU9VWM0_9CLOT
MSMDGAKALAAKVLTDKELAKQVGEAKTEAEFDAVVAKMGYTCSAEEFEAAFEEAQKNAPLTDDQLDQASGGLSIVGVDYAFTAVQTTKM